MLAAVSCNKSLLGQASTALTATADRAGTRRVSMQINNKKFREANLLARKLLPFSNRYSDFTGAALERQQQA